MSKRFHIDPSERVSIHEFDPTEVISDAPPNIIVIRARMSVEIAGRVGSEMTKLGADNRPELHAGAHTGALLLHNILSWSGPDFDDLPCTPENIRALPSANSDPFIEKVVNEIGERNKPRAGPNPKSATPSTFAKSGVADSNRSASNGSPASGESLSMQLATGKLKSPLQSAITGRRQSSED